MTFNNPIYRKYQYALYFFAVVLLGFFTTSFAEAATLSITPGTGVYSANNTFTVRVQVNTSGQPINAADGTISYNPRELSVISVNRTSSIFNLWVEEPSFSNATGRVSFSGGLPSGYTGTNGNIMSITFRAVGSGSSRVNFASGSVLANDGRGSNVLTDMNGAAFTIQSAISAPEPEVIEYIAPANTPSRPVITSSTHGDTTKWHNSNRAELTWVLPSDVTGVRTLLNDNPTSVPTQVYENPISSITLSDLDEGISYFHLQFRNAEGWGRVNNYRLAVDTGPPENMIISLPVEADLSSPNQVLQVLTEDEMSSVNKYSIVLNGNEPFDYTDESGSSTIKLTGLEPGPQSVIIEAFDEAGNKVVGTFTFTIKAFEKPIFTDYPTEINDQVIPVIKGTTRPNSIVTVRLSRPGAETVNYEVSSDDKGVFNFIPEGTLSVGVYELTAVAVDEYGARSTMSEVVRIAVQQPGFIKVGTYIINILSVLIPLIILLVFLVIGIWYLIIFSRRFRKTVRVESQEALEILNKEFGLLQLELKDQQEQMESSRKTNKLTKAESDTIAVMQDALKNSKLKVQKEISDIQKLVKKQ